MTLEDVPTDYIRRRLAATCADKVWKEDGETPSATPRNPKRCKDWCKESPYGWTKTKANFYGPPEEKAPSGGYTGKNMKNTDYPNGRYICDFTNCDECSQCEPGRTSYWAKSCLGGNWSKRSTTTELYCAKSCLGVFPKEYTLMVEDLCGLQTAGSMLDAHCPDMLSMSEEFQDHLLQAGWSCLDSYT